jgi:phosphoenolpyruvate carboxylase
MTQTNASDTFEQQVRLKYQLYNSLFLTLPFDLINQTGNTLPQLSEHCLKGYRDGKSPDEILQQFFEEYLPEHNARAQTDVLFNFVKYIERQVVLFDAVEEAAFDVIHDLEGPGTMDEFLARVNREAAVRKLRKKLTDFQLRIVLTAHPTQFYPGSVLGIITDLAEAIRLNEVTRVKELLLQLGKTPFINEQKPTPLDEARSLIWYLKNVFYNAVPEVVLKLKRQLRAHNLSLPNEALINLGFWPGGDRDGNPFVTKGITMETMALLHRGITSCYHKDARELRRRLTFKGVHEKITRIEYRLFDSVHQGEKAYNSVEELLQDLHEIHRELESRHNGLFVDLLEAFETKVHLFGFHFACLDIRQDSRKHESLIELILDRANLLSAYQMLDEEEKIAFLHKTDLQVRESEMPDELFYDIIGSINALHEIQNAYGHAACHRYIISNARGALDVVIVQTLIRWTAGDTSRVDIVPLFESVDTLRTTSPSHNRQSG